MNSNHSYIQILIHSQIQGNFEMSEEGLDYENLFF